jgi:hypothetical protein
VFTVKHKADESMERIRPDWWQKAFLKLMGWTIRRRSPNSKYEFYLVLLSFLANFDWLLQQLDVKNAVLHGDLEEEVYMDFPLGPQLCVYFYTSYACYADTYLHLLSHKYEVYVCVFIQAAHAMLTHTCTYYLINMKCVCFFIQAARAMLTHTCTYYLITFHIRNYILAMKTSNIIHEVTPHS